ncbi:cytokine-dependent hematopoietic cell linker-like [Acipenser ruthenus]|uniref:cytokine-dependent hematopoietic cell linker-like n=1 Tax=Acipenser ruthenus TaxID=7906 RepID=UPI00145A4CE4|nr:cytokine-dependent hematopoietic cell linker-like [Acipenser ruthenus]XP_033891905.3 cytokine-dependent hematopoietic cell linker-like [Acipenser ruthenus]
MDNEVDSDYELPDEDQYNTVEDPEERNHVRIPPVRRPRNADEDYADKRVMSYAASHSPQSSSPDLSKFRNIPPKTPKRTVPGPSVNRNLKPTQRLQPPTGETINTQYAKNQLPPPRPPRTLPKVHQPLPPEPGIRTWDQETETTKDKPWRPRPARKQNYVNDQSNECPVTLPPRINSPQQHKRTNVPGSRPLFTPPRHSQDLEFRQGSSTALNDRASPVSGITTHNSRYIHEWPETRNDMQKLKPTDLQKPTIPSSTTAQGSNRHSWYIGAYDRCEAETALYRMSVDGAFLVRDCSKKIADEPYVLVVFYENKVYNVKIRYLEQSQQYALGTGLWGNDTFDSISDIIEFHKIYPIILIDGKDKSGTQKEQCTLTYPVTENDIKNM